MFTLKLIEYMLKSCCETQRRSNSRACGNGIGKLGWQKTCGGNAEAENQGMATVVGVAVQ